MIRREMINCLRRYRYEQAHRRGVNVPNIAAMANCDRIDVIYLRDYGHNRGRPIEARITRAVEMIENGEVQFILHQPNLAKSSGDKGLVNARGEPRWRIEYVNKPRRRPPPEDRITRAADHRAFARCRTCQGDKFEAVVIHGAPFYACAQCCGPVHWPGMGAVKADAKSRLEMFESFVREDFSFV